MNEPSSAWNWAQQLPALGMILTFLWFAGKHGGKALMNTIKEIQKNCHDTMDKGHEVSKECARSMGESSATNRSTAALMVEVKNVMVEVKTLLIKKNGGG
jgi:hypothetical protein